MITSKRKKVTNAKRARVPGNLFLPKISLTQHKQYKQVKLKKEERKVYQYSDYSIDYPKNIDSVIELMESRPRFKELVKYTESIIRTRGNDEYETKYVINAQTVNDCRLCVLYICRKLDEACYHDMESPDDCLNYNRTFEYHTRYRSTYYTHNNPGNYDFFNEDDSVMVSLPNANEDNDFGFDDEPGWIYGEYPVFIDIKSAQKYIETDDFTDGHFRLIFVLEARESQDMMQMPDMGINLGIGIMPGDGGTDRRNVQELLTVNGFKTIHVPNADNAELKTLFMDVSGKMGMKVSKNVKFDALIEQYGNYMNSEYDLRGVVKAIKEHKIFNNTLNVPVNFKDFEAVCNPLKNARMDSVAEKAKKKTKDNPWTELNSLIGCHSIKTEIRRMVDYMLLDKHRRDYGIKSTHLTKHSVFFGSPGTAKTTVARLIAKILAHEGIIGGENFKECRKSDVTGMYVGWTAKFVNSMFKDLAEAGGGVIFFDEAYSYTGKDATSFDNEAVNCIVQDMENHRNIMCIFAGYEKEMKQFVEKNPGLRSRIGFTFKFDNYDAETTYKIAQYQAKMHGFELPQDCESMIVGYFNNLIRLQGEYYGNGRCARLLIEHAGMHMAARLAQQKRKPKRSECKCLSLEDLKCAIESSLEHERAFRDDEGMTIGFR